MKEASKLTVLYLADQIRGCGVEPLLYYKYYIHTHVCTCGRIYVDDDDDDSDISTLSQLI